MMTNPQVDRYTVFTARDLPVEDDTPGGEGNRGAGPAPEQSAWALQMGTMGKEKNHVF